jgi:hypothetical protein
MGLKINTTPIGSFSSVQLGKGHQAFARANTSAKNLLDLFG